VVFFHRIDDRYSEDPNTASIADFRAICLFLRRHFRVVPLAEIVTRLTRGADVGRLAAITFDDGYRDNATVAAPQLRALGLPATRKAVVDVGYRCAVETGDRAVETGADPYRIGRVGVSPWTGSGYELGVDSLRGILRVRRDRGS